MVQASPLGPERVVGRYALYGEIASGGMATVHFGRLLGPVGFSRTVAIKRLHPQFAKDPEFVSMFLDEARLAARIQHPNVVATLDVVALEGELFLVMEYVQGESLSRVLRGVRAANSLVPIPMAVTLMAGVAYGLHAAHEATNERGEPLEIVHRDVSPQNVLVGTDGVARVLDFGVAKAAGRLQSTREGQLKGKLAYMAVEQMRGQAVDRRVDVYGAAVVAWELLACRRLFDGEHEGIVFSKVMEERVNPPSHYRDDIPPGLDEVVMRGLSRDANERFATAEAFGTALEETSRSATPRQVGEWLARVAGDSLQKRAERVKEIESISSTITNRLLEGAASVDRPILIPGAPIAPPAPTSNPSYPSHPSHVGRAPQASHPSWPAASIDDAPTAADRSGSVATLVVEPVFDANAQAHANALHRVDGQGQPQSGVGTLSRSSVSVSRVPPPAPSAAAGSQKRALVAALGGGGAAVAVALALFAFTRPPVERAGAGVGRAVARSHPPVSTTATGAPPETGPSASATTSASTAVTALPTATGPKPPPGGWPRPQATSCNPPYEIDAKGVKRYKPKCLK